jgi:NADPH:quinone reductase
LATYSGIFSLLPLLTNLGKAHHGEILRHAARLVEAGKLRPQLDPRRFTLDSVGEAYEILADRSARGRLVVDVGVPLDDFRPPGNRTIRRSRGHAN